MAERKYEVESEEILEHISVEEFWKQILPRLPPANSLAGAILDRQQDQAALRDGVLLELKKSENRGQVWVPNVGNCPVITRVAIVARFLDGETRVGIMKQVRIYVELR